MKLLPGKLFARLLETFGARGPQIATRITKTIDRPAEKAFRPLTTYVEGPGGKEYARHWDNIVKIKDENGTYILPGQHV